MSKTRPPVLLDTTVVLRGFWPSQFANDPRTPPCARLVAHLEETETPILISAVSLTEFKVHDQSRELPLRSGIIVVPFDAAAARRLAAMADADEMKKMSTAGSTRTLVRYDLQIAACAIRHGASIVATLDGPLRKCVERMRNAGTVTLKCVEPIELLPVIPQQTMMDLSIPGPSSSEPDPVV